jgi:apolipoprotein N-acyltransferase
VFIGGYSMVRYPDRRLDAARSLQARVAVVQGNIDQASNGRRPPKRQTVATYLRLSNQAAARAGRPSWWSGRKRPCRFIRSG